MSPRPPERPLARLARVIVPGTTGGVYTLLPGALGFFVVLALYVHSYLSGRAMPDVTGELLTASVGMLSVHTVRGALADRANASAGIVPVPVDQGAPPVGGLPDLRPLDR